MRVCATLIIAATAASLAAAAAEETPAEPVSRPTPMFPETCLQKPDLGEGPFRVWVAYDLNRNGTPENVRVRESADPCFDDVTLAAVRRWEFEPRRIDGRSVAQTDLETVFIYRVKQREAQTQTYDARPVDRKPPRFPETCRVSRMPDGSKKDRIVVQFDVTATGETENIEIIESTNSCFNRTSVRSVERWKYAPALIDGEPVPRRGVQTVLVFMSADGRVSENDRISRRVLVTLRKAGRRIKNDPETALQMLAEIEAEHGDDFTAAEIAAFHQMRGYARIGVNDAAGALDDLRIARSRAFMENETREAVDETIATLEAFIAEQEAVAAQRAAAEQAGSAPKETSADHDGGGQDVGSQDVGIQDGGGQNVGGDGPAPAPQDEADQPD